MDDETLSNSSQCPHFQEYSVRFLPDLRCLDLNAFSTLFLSQLVFVRSVCSNVLCIAQCRSEKNFFDPCSEEIYPVVWASWVESLLWCSWHRSRSSHHTDLNMPVHFRSSGISSRRQSFHLPLDSFRIALRYSRRHVR